MNGSDFAVCVADGPRVAGVDAYGLNCCTAAGVDMRGAGRSSAARRGRRVGVHAQCRGTVYLRAGSSQQAATLDCIRHLVGGQQARALQRRIRPDRAPLSRHRPERQVSRERARVVQLVAQVCAAPHTGRVAGRCAAPHSPARSPACPVASRDDGPVACSWGGRGGVRRRRLVGRQAGGALGPHCSCRGGRASCCGCKRVHLLCHCACERHTCVCQRARRDGRRSRDTGPSSVCIWAESL